ncbi:MAG: GNAT family N-acetyltransferase [Acetobacteraceae bacterium]
MIIGPASANDAPAIAAIHLQARRAAMPYLRQVHSDAATHAWFAATVSLPPQCWWVARHDDQVVGYLRLEGELIDHLYVRPDWQRQGVGSRLLAKARALSPDRLRLNTFQRNTAARAFYEGHDFRAVGQTVGLNEENEPDVQYVWQR